MLRQSTAAKLWPPRCKVIWNRCPTGREPWRGGVTSLAVEGVKRRESGNVGRAFGLARVDPAVKPTDEANREMQSDNCALHRECKWDLVWPEAHPAREENHRECEESGLPSVHAPIIPLQDTGVERPFATPAGRDTITE